MLEKEGPEHRVASLRRELRLSVDVRHQSIPYLHDSAEFCHEHFAVLPRLRRGGAVATAVGGEYAEGQPPQVEGRGRALGEPPDEVAPEGEPTQSQRQTAP